ncbi:MAG: shikimate dehydrogenase [Halanaerobiales bacterium]
MIDANTKILGLIGYPLGHTISPLLHNHSITTKKLNYIYLPFPVEPDCFIEAVSGLKALNSKGFNITIPYKERIIPLLDGIDPLAEKIGAVNTVLNDNGRLIGYNTDVSGLIRSIKEDARFNMKGKIAMVIGAGGAARAAGIALLESGVAELYLLNRSLEKADKLAVEWREYYPLVDIYIDKLAVEFYKEYIDRIDILIDTTPVGMEPNVNMLPVVEPAYIHKEMLVVDLVYNPRKTSLLKAAESAGANCLGGMGMLLYQGIEAFKIWTGVDIEPQTWWSLV